MTRTFIAIELGDDARAYLEREIAWLERALPAVRWVDPLSLHLTLAFLGELDDERLAAATEAVEAVARTATPFTLEIAGLGSFGPPAAPRVIWAGIAGNVPRLSQLHRALVTALEARGFPREERPFSPHLTLARLRMPLAPPELGRLQNLLRGDNARARSTTEPARIPADHLSVMKSELRRPAARYTCLRAVPLAGEQTPPE